MKYVAAIAFAAGLALVGPASSWAADAARPYSNIDRKVDAGNNTGDSIVPKLNEQQLQLNGIGSRQAVLNDASGNPAAVSQSD